MISIMVATTRAPASEGRRERRKRETRTRLVDAAVAVIGRGGVDAATVATVTEEADVGFGTFYSYFASVEELLRAAVADRLDHLGRHNDAIAAAAGDDPALAFSIGVRNTIALVERERGLAAFAVSLLVSGRREPWEALSRRMARDLRAGAAAGRFRVEITRTLVEMIAGGVIGVLRARLEGRVPANAPVELVAHALRLLGLSDAEAWKIAGKPLPRTTRRIGGKP
ncbi:HTH-type transcriptional repressor KstR [Burkholderiales bacterium]|jgi:AcrR family transcriptional regulator|nr:HTH-type transcriptional repressor KstR [Burkholderiales bacterium]